MFDLIVAYENVLEPFKSSSCYVHRRVIYTKCRLGNDFVVHVFSFVRNLAQCLVVKPLNFWPCYFLKFLKCFLF